MIHNISKWTVYLCALAFGLSRCFIMYDFFLFHIQDMKDDTHFHLFCVSNDLPDKYIDQCTKAKNGVSTPIIFRIVRDTIEYTTKEIIELGNFTYSWIAASLFGTCLLLWIISGVFGRIHQRNQSFIIPVSQPMSMPMQMQMPMYNNYNQQIRHRHPTIEQLE